MKIYHILGADIPHHNQTVLDFLHNELAGKVDPQALFAIWIVGVTPNNKLSKAINSVTTRYFSSKITLVKQMISTAKRDNKAFFFLHGQFNVWIWLALLFGLLPKTRVAWHIWGADLYQDSQKLKFKLFYPIRRLAQKRLCDILGTAGDLAVVSQINKQSRCTLLYFPSKMPPQFDMVKQKSENITILLGNSGDPSNRHLLALTQIKQQLEQLGKPLKIIIPMGYPANNQQYIEQVRAKAYSLFAESAVQIVTEKLDFAAYLELLKRCDLGYFIFNRQQGIGTICLMTALNIPVVLHQHNPFCMDMQQQAIPFIQVSDDLTAELNETMIEQSTAKLLAMDKTSIAFFPPNYLAGWREYLAKIVVK